MSKSVYLSPSTQGDNIGVGNYGNERDRMNQVCDVVERVLKQHGVVVYRNNPGMTLKQIVADSNSKCPDVHFAIHSNSGGGRGTEIFCYKFGVVGEGLARKIYDNLSPITPTCDRGVKQGFDFYGKGKHMYEVAYTDAPAALAEIAFHDSHEDANWIINNMEAIGVAMAKGVLEHFGITYIGSEPAASSSNVLYRVMVCSFSVKANAENRIQDLKNAGYDAVIMPYGNLYRVMCGSYAIRANADIKIQDLKRDGFEAVIMPFNK